MTATLAQTTAGRVRFCLFPAAQQPNADECRIAERATLTAANPVDGTTKWRVTAIGVDEAVSPSADIRLEFRATNPKVIVDGFRFQGAVLPAYNGVLAQFRTRGAGDVTVTGHWDGASRPWHAALVDNESGESIASQSGTGNDLQLTGGVAAGQYRLRLENTEEVAAQEVFLRAIITWP